MMSPRLAMLGCFLLGTFAAHASSAEPGPSCTTTVAPSRPFSEPSPSSASRFWYGSEALAVLLNRAGTWQGMGLNHNYRDKLFWWREGYSGVLEARPALTVSARRLDGHAPPFRISGATNAHNKDFGGWAMLVMVEFPTAGCWEVTGQYKDETLNFVVQVGA
jgi:hypothetical protein